MEGLVQADRVVEKIGVHYERFAKRVDVKKLKGSIWDHLEKKVSKDEVVEEAGDAENALNESGKRPREPEADETTFKSVVENVAGKVPSNVTVSFYFICVLHLANEKGLELKGQDDLRNFQIRKEKA
ncbi:Condensin complex subunit 2 [Phytophthora infestans]|nr:Condensin complex subunit 2 [Phytophthora infestans]